MSRDGGSSDFRIVLPAAPSRFSLGKTSGLSAAFVPGYSGVSVVESHHLPSLREFACFSRAFTVETDCMSVAIVNHAGRPGQEKSVPIYIIIIIIV